MRKTGGGEELGKRELGGESAVDGKECDCDRAGHIAAVRVDLSLSGIQLVAKILGCGGRTLNSSRGPDPYAVRKWTMLSILSTI